MNKSKNTIGLLKYSKEIQQEMEDKLEKSMFKLLFQLPYKKITISLLCREANVSRMAYYAHFTDKDQILERLVIKLNKDLIAAIGSPFNIIPDLNWYKNLFKYIYDKKEIIQHLFEAGFFEKYLTILNEVVLKNKNANDFETIRHLVWNGGIINAVKYWLDHLNLSIDEIADYCYRSFNPYLILKKAI